MWLIDQFHSMGVDPGGGGGGIYPPPPIFEVGDGLYYHPPSPNILRLNVILYRQNILSTNKNNERNNRFGM